MTDDITLHVPTATDWDAIFEVATSAFNDEPDEAVSAAEAAIFEPERGLVARRDGAIVGTAAVMTRQLSVPGGNVPAGHVTLVTVDASARRRGILRRFMHQQFADMRAAGEPVAVLWASEGRIYQRFGYGLAVRRLSLKVDTREASLTVPDRTGRLRTGTPADLRDTLVKVYDQVYSQRPGWSERLDRHWDYRLADLPSYRRGATAMRAVIHEGDTGVDGYALWRTSSQWDENGPNGEVRVLEHVATTPQAYAAIWRFLFTMDLTRSVQAWACGLDEPLQFMVNEPRRLGARATEALWLRVIDLPAALAARRYATAVEAVFEITDDLLPQNSGRWRLTGSPAAAACAPTTEEPDLRCDIRSLAAAYLGGTPLTALAAGGLVDEVRPGALAQVSTAFGWPQTPSAIEVF
ncbi:MAG TPA: GNAT family N-acetyltransferase [Micromonosporaceae bacterium]